MTPSHAEKVSLLPHTNDRESLLKFHKSFGKQEKKKRLEKTNGKELNRTKILKENLNIKCVNK